MHFGGSASVESLESRRLLSIDLVARSGWAYAVGSAGDDVIGVRVHARFANFVTVVIVNSAGRQEASFAANDLRVLHLAGGGGDDELWIDPSLATLAPDVSAWVEAGDGDDRVRSALPGTVNLGAGNDRFDQSPDQTFRVDAGDGNDAVELGDGSHTIVGGAGNDRIRVGQQFWTIDAGAGDDRVTAPGGTGAIDLGDGRDVLALGDRADTLTRTKTRPRAIAVGGAGDDTMYGSSAADLLYGNDGNDHLESRSLEYDSYSGRSPKYDTLSGGAGDDTFLAIESVQLNAFGDDGNDRFELNEGQSAQVSAGAGDDVMTLTGFNFGNINGEAGEDRITLKSSFHVNANGGDGDDRLISTGSDRNKSDGGEGDDVIDARGSIYSAENYGQGTYGESIYGGAGEDTLLGGKGICAYGNGGRDRFEGRDWNDRREGDPPRPSYGGVVGGVIDSGSVLTGRGSLTIGGGTLRTVTSSLTNITGETFTLTDAGDPSYLALEPVGDVGFLHVRKAGAINSYYPQYDVPRPIEPVELGSIRRDAMRVGIVRLPTGWKVTPAAAPVAGIACYDIRYGDGGGHAKTAGTLAVYQLYVGIGTIVVTRSGPFKDVPGVVRTARAEQAMRLLPGDVARIAGRETTYVVSHRLPEASVRFPAGRRGLPVEGGVLWFGKSVDRSASFTAIP